MDNAARVAIGASPGREASWPQISYLICATPRTGSYLLCKSLTRSGVAGRPAEYFWHGHEPSWIERWGAATPREYLLHAVAEGATPNGVFGFKTMWEYVNELTERLRNFTPYRLAYEDFAPDREQSARAIIDWLGLDASAVTFGPHHLRRQSDAVTEEWATRYRAGQ